MKKTKCPRPKDYTLLTECVESGIRWGWDRAHKHTSTPAPELIAEKIRDEIMMACAEAFTFRETE
jgi:hypothetical protein